MTNIGNNLAIFEAVHGSAPDIAGKNLANPTAMMFSGVHMLKYIGECEAAIAIEKAISNVLGEGKFLTCDLGGSTSTSEFTDQVLAAL